MDFFHVCIEFIKILWSRLYFYIFLDFLIKFKKINVRKKYICKDHKNSHYIVKVQYLHYSIKVENFNEI